jgi:hypothetical protein
MISAIDIQNVYEQEAFKIEHGQSPPYSDVNILIPVLDYNHDTSQATLIPDGGMPDWERLEASYDSKKADTYPT